MNAQAEKKESQPKNTLETRVTRLETGFEYLATKADIASVRTEIANVENRLNDKIHTEVSELRKSADRDFRILFGALIAVALGLDGDSWPKAYIGCNAPFSTPL
ncbi:hypothetical protein [Liberibacter crescens]|uniref:hypothetical protein n=1 Tax=Liberibacter crescens TaxID=1273132 RepID=UPI0005A1024E|nr:hypothetical protein [Liberibacter crescens]AMC12925.1 hypothetical protein RL73_04550 [Liberibacter crescens]